MQAEVVVMGRKVFREHNGLKLISDERDVEVPAKYRVEVKEWCNENGIEATLASNIEGSAWTASIWGVNIWRVKDTNDRALFVLRWS
jgi:hypothetical protein